MENALRVNMYRAFSNDEKQTIKANDNDKQKRQKNMQYLNI